MDITKKAVVEPTKSAAQPVKAQQQQPEHKAQHEAAKPGGNQPKRSVRVGPTH